MMVLIPGIHRALPNIPLVAAGAVADGPGFAAVMSLGAEGIQMGTRFLATIEAHAPEYVTKLILAATDTSTMSAEGRVKPRVSKPEFAEAVLGEKRQSQMGQVAALITDIKSVEDVMREIIQGGFAQAQATSSALAGLAK